MERLQAIIQDVLDDSSFEISRETTAADHEDWDSLEQINIVVAIEREFSIRFRLSEAEGLEKVGDTVDLIESKLGQATD